MAIALGVLGCSDAGTTLTDAGAVPDGSIADGTSNDAGGDALVTDAPVPTGFGKALRFRGNGTNDQDRVKVRIDQPGQTSGTWPADVGATDFTIEWWMKGALAENAAKAVSCGNVLGWINGNIIVDRDRYNGDRKLGVSIGAGKVAFGVTGAATGDTTICGTTNVLDGAWHHVAVERRRSDGRMWIFVDGAIQAEADGPDGDVSYPNGAQPGNFCGGPCTNSDPFLVLGAEKHDADPVNYPAFSGTMDELRLSTTLRYSAPFTRPTQPFATDAQTLALYHFDEGQGDVVSDTSGAAGGPSNGERKLGGNPAGPEWVDAQ